jgi:hypothetical protein
VLHVSFASQWTAADVGLAAGHMLCFLSAELLCATALIALGVSRAPCTLGSQGAVLTHMQFTSFISTAKLVKAACFEYKNKQNRMFGAAVV